MVRSWVIIKADSSRRGGLPYLPPEVGAAVEPAAYSVHHDAGLAQEVEVHGIVNEAGGGKGAEHLNGCHPRAETL